MPTDKIRDVLNEINSLISILLSENIIRGYNSAIRIDTHAGAITGWTSMKSLSPLDDIGRFASLTGYIDIVDKNYYHLMLFDGSLLQLNYTFSGQDLISHRLCYIPCPIILNTPLDEDIEVRSRIEATLLSQLDRLTTSTLDPTTYLDFLSRPPIRFDYDPRAAKIGHPASHVHIGWDDCRIAAKGPLSPGIFVRFILSNFYGNLIDKPNISKISGKIAPSTIAQSELKELHFNIQ